MLKKLFILFFASMLPLSGFAQRHDSVGNKTDITPYRGGISAVKYVQLPGGYSPLSFDSCRMVWYTGGALYYHDCIGQVKLLSLKDSNLIKSWAEAGTDDQTLSLSHDTLTIIRGNSVYLPYLHTGDTTAMMAGYTRLISFLDSISAIRAALGGKVNYSDTAAMLGGYARMLALIDTAAAHMALINARVKYSDSNSVYATKYGVDTADKNTRAWATGTYTPLIRTITVGSTTKSLAQNDTFYIYGSYGVIVKGGDTAMVDTGALFPIIRGQFPAEIDPIFTASVAHAITSTDTAHFNTTWLKYTVSGTYSAGTLTFTRNDGTTWTVTGLNTGTVTSFNASGLSPLFNVFVSSPSSTPALSFSQISQAANNFYAAPNGSSGSPVFRTIVAADLPAGTGTVTSLTSGNLPPLFSSSVTTSTTTPAITYTLTPAPPNTFLGGATSGTITPTYRTLTSGDIPALPYVSSVAAGTGLSGGTITTSGTISMPNVGTAGTYAYPSAVTTDAQGRVTAITAGSAVVDTATIAGTGIGITRGTNSVTVNVLTTSVNTTPINFGSNNTITAAPSGSAGGDLSGTYPNPTISTSKTITLTAGSGVTITGSATQTLASIPSYTIAATGTGGTVTSVALSAPTVFSVSGTPVTGSGTLGLTWNSGQTANQFLATPNGSAGAVGLRSIASADVPSLTGGQVGISGLSATGTPSSTTFLRGDNTWATPAGGGGSYGSTPPITLTGSNFGLDETVDYLWTGFHTFSNTLGLASNQVTLNGASSGYITEKPPASITSYVWSPPNNVAASTGMVLSVSGITSNTMTTSWTQSGTVTSVTAGTGLSGGTITGAGTISLPNTGTAGTYGSSTQIPVFTTDAQGRVSSVTNTTIAGIPTYTVQVSLSNSQLQNISSTPVTLLAAQGAGTLIVPRLIIFNYTFTTSSFSATALTFKIGSNVITTVPASFMSSGSSYVAEIGPLSSSTSTYVTAVITALNSALTITAGSNPTSGGGSAVVTVLYSVITP